MKIAFSGTHGTGKTTRTLTKAVEAKKKYPGKVVRTLNEVAADCPFGINDEATASSQIWIFSQQIRGELEQMANADILICDRTIADTLAYSEYFGFTHLAESLQSIVGYWLHTYNEIYLLSPQTNEFWFDDGVRQATDSLYRHRIHDILCALYAHHNVSVTII